MKLKVISTNEHLGYEYCQGEDGRYYYVDLVVDGGFPPEIAPADLVGKTVEVEELVPHMYVTHGVCKIL